MQLKWPISTDSTVPSNIKFFLHKLEYFLTLHIENTKYDEWSSMQLSRDKSETNLSKKQKRKMFTEKYFLNIVK